jgi:hypothetical protein
MIQCITKIIDRTACLYWQQNLPQCSFCCIMKGPPACLYWQK